MDFGKSGEPQTAAPMGGALLMASGAIGVLLIEMVGKLCDGDERSIPWFSLGSSHSYVPSSFDKSGSGLWLDGSCPGDETDDSPRELD